MQKIGFTLMEQAGQALPDNTPVKEHLAAFTLIELLVVVLIVGILAAIAVPQYKKAVLKSRFTTVMPMAKAVADAQEVYYLANGEYATQLPSLDIEKPEADTSDVLVGLKSTKYFDYVLGTRQGMNNNYIMYQKHSPNFASNIHCEAKNDDTQANDLCKALGGTQIGGSQTENYTTYILQGNADDGHLPIVYTNTSNGETVEELDTCKATTAHGCYGQIRFDGGTCTMDRAASNACQGGIYTNGATCIHNTGWSSGGCTFSYFNNSTCITNSGNSCRSTYTNQSECIATGNGCEMASFTDSTCTGTGTSACQSGTFKNSVCVGDGKNACSLKGGQQIPSFNNSTCFGNNDGTCSNGTFTNNSKCVMNHEAACQNNTYASGAYCEATGSYACPSGSATDDGQCWDGNGEKIACN